MKRDDPVTSPLGRMLRLGGLLGRVGASVTGSRVLTLGRSAAEQRRRRLDNLVTNAGRIVATLGELKGAAMKVGQMLSLHEGLVPPEVAAVLRGLQDQAPRASFEVMEAEVRRELSRYDELFDELTPEAFAAASIGQVHSGRLRDGREVAVKIQYPEIERVVRADLTNLRRVLQSLFALVSEADFEPVWQELRERLLEELDYTQEATHLRRMADLHAGMAQIVIPDVVDEASTRRVLTMTFVPGISADEACSTRYPQELRDRWGQVLLKWLLRCLLRHRLLHADPNLANFAFREDGSVVVYDFGCVKEVPLRLARGYARLMLAGLEGRAAEIPAILHDMGVCDEAGGPLGRDLTDPYVELFVEIYRDSPPYRFGEDEALYRRLIDLGVENWSQQLDVRFPRDIVFVQRALSGHFGNLARLRAAGPWRRLVREQAETVASNSE